MSFEENVNSLKSAACLDKIDVIKNSKLIGEIKNDVSTKESLKIYAHLVDFDNGSIYYETAQKGLELYAETVKDAKQNPGKHPNIDRLLDLKENEFLKIVVHYRENEKLRENIEKFANLKRIGKLLDEKTAALAAFNELMDLLESGMARTAQIIDGEWQANLWVKEGIMLGFVLGNTVVYRGGDDIQFTDKETFPLRKILPQSQIRLVPPATGLRRGAFAGKGVIFMPPAYANVGAHISNNSMIENLAGSCCQVGRDCHISAGAIIGGVLDPIEATPVIIGDNVLLGEGSGITQGCRLGDLTTLAPGVHLSKATAVVDPIKNVAYTSNGICELVEYKMGDAKLFSVGKIIEEKDNTYGPEVPSGALVIPGFSMSSSGFPKLTPFVAKYITHKSQRAYALEDALRS
ncbi:MAG: DUF2322 family protein [Chitinispirillales bacterium]|nr:DUF2322 family protein [Chitinispirillales bacterium]